MSEASATAGSSRTLADVELRELQRALSGTGLWIDIGASTLRAQSNSALFADQVQVVYGAFPFVDDGEWADLHVQLRLPSGLRRWLRPQIQMRCDGQRPFAPFPGDSPLPLFEWGCNWLIGRRLNDLLLLHAGAVEKDGLTLLLPALPGSGKSTLTAALSLRGWRLLSDEFGAFEPETGVFHAILKPVALKNQSIDVIRRFAPQASIGPRVSQDAQGYGRTSGIPNRCCDSSPRKRAARCRGTAQMGSGKPDEMGAGAGTRPVPDARIQRVQLQCSRRCRIQCGRAPGSSMPGMATRLQRSRRSIGYDRRRMARRSGAPEDARTAVTSARPRSQPQMAWLQSLRQPQLTLDWSLAEWERVVRLARRLRLLARLAESLTAHGLIDRVPLPARRHLIAEQRLSRWRTGAMLWAMERVTTMLGESRYPRVLLKGAAYIAQELPIAAGRLPSDLDILVPHAHLDDALTCLQRAGWKSVELDEHDRRYYHDWSHEVPPMTHPLHAVELDLHHNILPPVARTNVDADSLLARLKPSKWPPWQVLDPVDQVLHCAAHLFLDSDARDRLRDLVDLDGMLHHFGSQAGFWSLLPERAQALGLAEPLALACHFTVCWLGTPIPPHTLVSIVAIGPSRSRRAWLLPLLERALIPTEPDDNPLLSQDLAAIVLLARYHRQRMPLRILVPHLWHKLRVGSQGSREKPFGGGGR